MLSQITDYLTKGTITQVRHIDSDITIVMDEIKLWVTTPWRLENEGRVVMGNDNLVELLVHEDYKDDYQDCVTFISKSLNGTSITKVSYTPYNELILKFSNGITFRSFQTNGSEEDDADSFQLYIPKKRYIATPGGIELEDLGPFYKG